MGVRAIEFSDMIADQLTLRGWTVYRLAQVSDIPYTTLAPICAGKVSPSYATLQAICKGFGLTPSEFFRLYDPTSKDNKQETTLLRYWSAMDDTARDGLLYFLKSMMK